MKLAFRRRSGVVMVTVLVAVAMLSLLVYSFADTMVGETILEHEHAKTSQLRWTARSGLEYAADVLSRPATESPRNVLSNPDFFQDVSVSVSPTLQESLSFSIVQPITTANRSDPVFGVLDESSKLNLNYLATFVVDPMEARRRLLFIPKMTPQLADAILDFIDTDEQLRPLGAESAYYQSQRQGSAANRPLESLTELLRVRGVTHELLFGEDSNNNGWLDWNENDGDDSVPRDNSDGELDQGWSAFVSTVARESNLRPDGKLRIFLNGDNLAELYDQLDREFGSTIASFVVAYRMEGSLQREQEDEEVKALTPEQERAAVELRARRQLGLDDAPILFEEIQTRGGLELLPPSYEIRSLWDLVGVSVRVEINGRERIIDSPWSSNPTALDLHLPLLKEAMTVHEGTSVLGRINPVQAEIPVLNSIPEIRQETVIAIADAQLENATQEHLSLAWLLRSGVADITELRRLAPHLTNQGNAFRVYVMCHSESRKLVKSAYINAGRVFQTTEFLVP